MKMSRDELSACLIYQVGALKACLDAEGMELNHIKPHGALYGVAARDEAVAHAVCDAAQVFGVALLGMAATKHEEVYTKRGIAFQAEYYTDLDYAETACSSSPGTRGKGRNEAARRAVRAVKEGKATSVTARTFRCAPSASACIRHPVRSSWRRPCGTHWLRFSVARPRARPLR
jgi:UPF0271 protein